MLKQEYLNSITLKKASEEISNALIAERMNLRKKKADLEEMQKGYQNDYIAANDGDSSENAPLEQAIQNLKTTTGDIVAVTKKIQTLDKIEDSVYVSAVYDFEVLMRDLSAMKHDSIITFLSMFGSDGIDTIGDRIRDMTEDELREAVLEFDKYYSDTMTNVILDEYPLEDPLWKSRSRIEHMVDMKLKDGVLAAERKVLSDLERIKEMKAVPPYNYCGVIVMYTTVRLSMEGRKFTYKIYPRGLSFIDEGVMASNSRLATALIGRHVGDTVSIKNVSGGRILNYKVEDIY